MKRKPAAHIQCPACPEIVKVPIAITLSFQGDRQYLECEPDMTDLWAHARSHGVQGNFGDDEKP